MYKCLWMLVTPLLSWLFWVWYYCALVSFVFMVITHWKSSTLTLAKKAWVLVNVFQLTMYNSTNRFYLFLSMGYVLILTSNNNVTHWPLFIGNCSDLTISSLRPGCSHHIKIIWIKLVKENITNILITHILDLVS